MTTTIGADTFTIYGTIAALATHANGSLNYAAIYTAATADARARALVGATRLLVLFDYTDVANADPAAATGAVVTAAYELALAAIADPKVLIQASTASRVKRLNAKGAEVEYFAPSAGSRFPAVVMLYLAPLLASTSTSTDINGASYVSGVSECSDFDEADRYGWSG